MLSAPPNGMASETHNIPPGEQKEERLFGGDQVVGRRGPTHHLGGAFQLIEQDVKKTVNI